MPGFCAVSSMKKFVNVQGSFYVELDWDLICIYLLETSSVDFTPVNLNLKYQY